jgi:hypothetical protein
MRVACPCVYLPYLLTICRQLCPADLPYLACYREWTEDGQLWVQYVSSTPATRLDVINLQEKLDQQLQQRQVGELHTLQCTDVSAVIRQWQRRSMLAPASIDYQHAKIDLRTLAVYSSCSLYRCVHHIHPKATAWRKCGCQGPQTGQLHTQALPLLNFLQAAYAASAALSVYSNTALLHMCCAHRRVRQASALCARSCTASAWMS